MAGTRELRTVTPYRKATGELRCKVELASGQIVALHDLSRPELAAAARMVFPEIAGNVWLKLGSDMIRDLIRGNDLAMTQAEVARALELKAATPKAVTPQPEPKVETWTPAPDSFEGRKAAATERLAEEQAPKAGDPAQQLANLITQLSAGSIDVAQVAAMVTAEVSRQVVEIGIVKVEIQLPGQDAQQLPELSHEALPELVTLVASGLNVFMVGPAGSGKSTLAHQAATAVTTKAHPDGLPFYALSLGPTTPTSKLFGYMDAQGRYVRTPFREAYENGGVILLDELDNGHPGLVAELNQATANGYCAFADGMVQRHSDCRIVATGNTFGRGPDRLFVGRNILDAATLDRFVTVEIAIDQRLEGRLARGFATDETRAAIDSWIGYVQEVRGKAEQLKLPVIVSPRATIDGAKLLACGLSRSRVEEIRLFAGMGADIRAKLA